MSLPIISIVGRPNVGKSSLFNRLAKRRISIVADIPGVTRDRVSVPVALTDDEDGHWVEIVDTGGMGIEDSDALTEDVEYQISHGISKADVVIFVVDAREGIVMLDSHVARSLRQSDKPVIFVANKVDEANLLSEIGEMTRLGFGEPIGVSASHGIGIPELRDAILDKISHLTPQKVKDTAMQLAIVGKRNAGKSTFINALAGEKRVIVSEVAGTTRDSVDVQMEIDGLALTLIDTAGVKRKKKIRDDIEFYSQHRAIRSVRRADVVAMMIDASVPVSVVDKNLASTIAEEYKPVLIVVNKWDLAKDHATTDDYAEYFAKTFPSLSYAPIIFTSASEGVNVKQVVKLAAQLCAQGRARMSTGQLNAAIEQIVAKRGPSHKAGTKRPKIFYTSQIDTEPPTVVLFVNDARSFDTGYQRFLINQLREFVPYSEIPIRLMFRGKDKYTERNPKVERQQERARQKRLEREEDHLD